MAIRLRIPLLLDLLIASHPGEISELSSLVAVNRPVVGGRHLINRLIASRIDPGMRFGEDLLPVFRPREERSPPDDRVRFTEAAAALGDERKELIALLARSVAGFAIERPEAEVAQELLGKLFDSEYQSSAQLYRDAISIQKWLGPLGIMGFGRRKLVGAKRRLYSAAGGNLDSVHATSIAIHGFLESLEKMRALVRDDQTRTQLSTKQAVARSLVAPALLLRSSRSEFHPTFTRRPVGADALVLMRLERAHVRDRNSVSPFASGDWNECPAIEVVPRLLGEIWEARRQYAPIPARRAWGYERLAEWVSDRLLHRFTWHKLPGLLGVIRLVGIRTWMRRERLIDTEPDPAPSIASPIRPTAARLAFRSPDGSWNDLDLPEMGSAGTRFGRNLPPKRIDHDLLDPNPRALSLALMTRTEFKPAPGLNVLAAAWIQFMVHDWVNHETEETPSIEIEPAPNDPHYKAPIPVARTKQATQADGEDSKYLNFENTETHWWDASQLYGSSAAIEADLRLGKHGHLRLTDDRRLMRSEVDNLEMSGFTNNWWLGLSLFHTLFSLEHNAICDALSRQYPAWTDDQLFGTARLVVAALLAKIHTLEWTPAILDHPALHTTVETTWLGVFREWGQRTFGRIGVTDLWSGAPGSDNAHHGVRYAQTEEFVAVYRMHQLLPDSVELGPSLVGGASQRFELGSLIGQGAQDLIDEFGFEAAMYSLGSAHAGAITLNNFPAVLQHLERAGEATIDLAAIDIFRDRERGIPRFNEFREHIGLKPFPSFAALCQDTEVEKILRDAYGDDLSKVDLQVGMAAESKPAGFGFGETAFRVFAVMAIRRLKSDRFFTTDYTADTYSPAGLEWIESNDLGTVLHRHFPRLTPHLRGLVSPFAPWRNR